MQPGSHRSATAQETTRRVTRSATRRTQAQQNQHIHLQQPAPALVTTVSRVAGLSSATSYVTTGNAATLFVASSLRWETSELQIVGLPQTLARNEIQIVICLTRGAFASEIYIRCGFLGRVRVCMRSLAYDDAPVVGPLMNVSPRKLIGLAMPSKHNIFGVESVLVQRFNTVYGGASPATRLAPDDFFRVPDKVFVLRRVLRHYNPGTSRSRLELEWLATQMQPGTGLGHLVEDNLQQLLQSSTSCIIIPAVRTASAPDDYRGYAAGAHGSAYNANINNSSDPNIMVLRPDTPVGSIPMESSESGGSGSSGTGHGGNGLAAFTTSVVPVNYNYNNNNSNHDQVDPTTAAAANNNNNNNNNNVEIQTYHSQYSHQSSASNNLSIGSYSFRLETDLDDMQTTLVNLRRVLEITRGPKRLRIRTFLRGFRNPASNVSRLSFDVLSLIAERV